jgi:hypothetical protein
MSYGVKIEKMLAGAASYVDRILRGALPNCLFKPQPNLSWSCAKKLCAIRPATAPALLARADGVITRCPLLAADMPKQHRDVRCWDDCVAKVESCRAQDFSRKH